MGNILGAAFGLGARDVGLNASLGAVTKNLESINGLLDEQNKKGGLLAKVWGSVRKKVTDFNVASIAGNMRTLAGETGNLSNSIESMAVSYQQAAKPIIASMKLSDDEVRKMTGRATSMAIALNTSADAVAETFKAIHDAGAPARAAIDAMGMSEKEWVKVTQTTGVTMQDFSGIMGDMVASWGASPKQAADMVDNLMAIGVAAKIGTSAIKGAKQQLDALDAVFEQLPPSMARSADEIQNLMESTYKLAGAFREMGETEEQATQLGQDTAKMFADQAVMIEKLYRIGGEGDLSRSPLFKFISMLGVGTEEARAIVDEGSRDVVKGVSRINDIFRKMGGKESPQVQYALAELNKEMGQSAAGLGWLASNLDVGSKSLAAMRKMTVDGEKALKKYGNQAYSTGRTLQDQFDLARESFDTQLRRISRANVKGLVGEQTAAYKRVGKEFRGLASDETWGSLVKSLSVFKQMGLKGLMLDVAKGVGGKDSIRGATEMGVKLDTVLGVARQLGDELGPAMEILGKFGPLGMMGGGLAAWFAIDKEQQDRIKKMVAPIFEWMGTKIKETYRSLIDPEMIDKMVSQAGNLMKRVINTAIEWGEIGKKIFGSIPWRKMADELVMALGEAFKGSKFGTITGIEKAAHEAATRLSESAIKDTNKKIAEEDAKFVSYLRKRVEEDKKEIADLSVEISKLDERFFSGLMSEQEWTAATILKKEDLERLVSEVAENGKMIAEQVGAGIVSGAPAIEEGMSEAILKAADQLPQSEPKEGPMAGSFLRDSGYEMMMLIGDGIQEAEEEFKGMFGRSLDNSVMTTLEEYDHKIHEWSKKKSLIRSVAAQMVKDFGGNLNFGTIRADGVELNAKKTFEAALEVPGLAGVIAAIVSNGHQDRVLLKSIADDVRVMANSPLSGGVAGTMAVLPS